VQQHVALYLSQQTSYESPMKKIIFVVVTLLMQQAVAIPEIKSITGTDLLTNKKITVTAENKKGLVVIFLSAKCPCSNSHITELKNIAEKYPEFSYIGIHSNSDESKDLTLSYFEKVALPFPIIHDQNNEWADQLQAFKTPHAFIILKNGDFAYQGGVSSSKDFSKSDRQYLRDALDDIHHDKKVEISEGRTLGCAIPRGGKSVW
jgi:Redoxin